MAGITQGAECGDLSKATGRVLEIAAAMDAIVIGPGLGRSEKTQDFVLDVVARCGSTIAKILSDAGVEPAPERSRYRTWSQFLKRHWSTLLCV